MVKLLSTLLLLSIIAVPAYAATIYKWKDKEGQIHYTRTPPPKSMTNEEVESQDATKVPSARIEEHSEITGKSDTKQQPPVAPEMNSELKRRQELCQSAQYDLNEMRRTDKVTEHGHQIEITEDERLRRLDELKAMVREYCTPVNPQPVPLQPAAPAPSRQPAPVSAPQAAPMPAQNPALAPTPQPGPAQVTPQPLPKEEQGAKQKPIATPPTPSNQ